MQRRSTSQDISWFLDLRRQNQFDLDPPYQRRSVWNLKDRRFFLDTIFRGYPCPPVFLHKTLGDKQETVYAVVDGKQRLQTIFMFVEGHENLSLDENFGDARFNGKLWKDLGSPEKQSFWDYVIPVEFLLFDPKDPQEVNQAFDRLNRNMRKLEPQELRHARWGGWLITLVEAQCEDNIWRKLGVVTNARATRMKDAQFISELVLVLLENKQFGFDQEVLDSAYAKYDDLQELDLPVNPDEVKERLDSGKAFLVEVQEVNGSIKKYASTLATFYTLWVATTLHRAALGEANDFAARFEEFGEKMDILKEAADPAALLSGAGGQAYKRPSEFLAATKGASTDLGPRAKRLEALLAFIKGE